MEAVYLYKGDPRLALPGYDHTKLSAVNTCVTWGVMRYVQHRAMPSERRAMPLEAGSLMHEVFSVVRIASMWNSHPDHVRAHITRLFDAGRSAHMLTVMERAESEEARYRHVALETIDTSTWEDSEFDKRRTKSNIEAACVAYAGQYDAARYPVWVRDDANPLDDIGVEIPFSICLTPGTPEPFHDPIRYTGVIDGIHWHKEVGGELLVHENKSGSRLDSTWAAGFDMSHQVTGYVIAASCYTGHPVRRAMVRGTQLPLPRMVLAGLQDLWVARTGAQIGQWYEWVQHSVAMVGKWEHDVIHAPKYTHSCTRYFRPCSLIPFCAGDEAEKEQILDEMVHNEWNPLTKDQQNDD